MGKIIFFWIAILFFATSLRGEVPEIKRERIFTGDGLYGFMNGGADLYLEYGVKSLINRDIVYKGENFTIDIYEMPTPEDAFGIYSMHVYRCQQVDTLDMINCFSPYQLQAVIANLYISIVFPSGSSKAQGLAPELLPLYVMAPGLSKPEFPETIFTKPPYSGNIKFLRGSLSTSSASNDLATLMQEIKYVGIWFANDKKAKTYQAYIQFTSETEKNKLKASLSEADVIKEEQNILYIKRKEKPTTPTSTTPFGF